MYGKSYSLPTGVGYVPYISQINVTWHLHVPVAFIIGSQKSGSGSLLSFVVVEQL